MSGVSYASLAELRQEVGGEKTAEDALLLAAGRRMTEAVDKFIAQRYIRTTFIPRLRTLYFDACQSARLELDTFFGALTSVVDGESATLVSGTDYLSDPRNATPIRTLRRLDATWGGYVGDSPLGAIAITGEWCYREFYEEAWFATTTIGAELSSSATTITVASAARLSPGMLIRIGSEWLSIESIATNTLTLNRAERGTTAATHANGAAVDRFVPEPTITRAVQRWAGLIFARKGAFEQTRFDGTSSIEFPDDMPAEVKRMVSSGGWTLVRPVTV